MRIINMDKKFLHCEKDWFIKENYYFFSSIELVNYSLLCFIVIVQLMLLLLDSMLVERKKGIKMFYNYISKHTTLWHIYTTFAIETYYEIYCLEIVVLKFLVIFFPQQFFNPTHNMLQLRIVSMLYNIACIQMDNSALNKSMQ